MKYLMHDPSMVAIILAFACIIIVTLKRYKQNTKCKQPPKAGGSWPIIGHLPLLDPSKLPHKVLGTMADKYGPIFAINLGVHEAVVISSSEMAKECLLTNDKAALGRPKSIAIELMSYNYAIFGFSPYGSYWRIMRKIVVLELLSNYRVSMLSYVWKSEINILTKKMYDTWNKEKNSSGYVTVDMKQLFGDFALKTMLRIIASKQLSVNSDEWLRFQKAVRGFFEYVGGFVIGDALPFLRWLDLGGKEKDMKRVFRDLDDIIEGWLQEHKENNKNNNKQDNQDFMDVMLSVLDHDATKDCNYSADIINKSTCLMMIAGGTDTSTVSLTWAFSLLMNNPQALKKAKDELSLVVGKERQVSEDDIPKLKYLQAIVKETLRLYPAGPLMGPREFIEDCTVNGYHIKRGTQLIVNLSKIFTDPQHWEDPSEFRPERFLTTHKDIDVKGQHIEFFPFGAGRRICPGISFGLQVVHLTLASVLHGFEYVNPNDTPIDMNESFGLTNVKTNPVNVLVKPSLSSEFYAN
ncbi:cytochrome P450 CYP82D47-like [Silene latifolia]|uniref:cytochrome P450 CYP82D47-like n=1 Tax=Silene latifolia TaxID=37657 RepID=UPI003D770D66